MKGKIFNQQEVKAILNGDKTMFRELLKTNQSFIEPKEPFGKSPYQIGQKIFVKEKFIMKQEHSRLTLLIKKIDVERLADISEEDAIKEGATSRPNCEGYENKYDGWSMNWSRVGKPSKWSSNRKILSESDVCNGCAYYAFFNCWNKRHKKPEEKFEANPWVWVINFEVVK